MTRGPAETGHGWPGAAPRVGLGCMRLSTAEDRDDDVALATITAAVEAGITVFDTARAYGRGEADLGHNERLLARALRACGAAGDARVVTKGGMARPKGAWVPDGRAKAIRADCEASLVALDGLPIDLYLVHAPDPRTPWRTTLRALVRLVEEGLVRHVGVANVNRPQLDEALGRADRRRPGRPQPVRRLRAPRGRGRAVRRGGIAVIAHSPLGGPRRKRALARNRVLGDVASAHGATPRRSRSPGFSTSRRRSSRFPARGHPRPRAPRPGRQGSCCATRTARRWPPFSAEPLRVDDRDLAPQPRSAEVVLVMGIPGAGKTRVASGYVDRGYARLNRDVRGGSLRDLAEALDESLGAGTPAAFSTTPTSPARRAATCSTSQLGTASSRLRLARHPACAGAGQPGRAAAAALRLPAGPEELRRLSRTEPGVLAPTSQMRALRELEPPSPDEGFARVQRVPFERERSPGGATGLFVARTALRREGWRREVALAGESTGPTLLFDWSPDGRVHDLAADGARLAAEVRGPVETALCPHGGGPPICWCRPPLPGLLLEFARAHDVDAAASVLVGASPAHRTLAEALGARYLAL